MNSPYKQIAHITSKTGNVNASIKVFAKNWDYTEYEFGVVHPLPEVNGFGLQNCYVNVDETAPLQGFQLRKIWKGEGMIYNQIIYLTEGNFDDLIIEEFHQEDIFSLFK